MFGLGHSDISYIREDLTDLRSFVTDSLLLVKAVSGFIRLDEKPLHLPWNGKPPLRSQALGFPKNCHRGPSLGFRLVEVWAEIGPALPTKPEPALL